MGGAVQDLAANRKTVVEGYRTTHAVRDLCRRQKIHAPILEEVYLLLYEEKDPRQALLDLMLRELKAEHPGA